MGESQQGSQQGGGPEDQELLDGEVVDDLLDGKLLMQMLGAAKGWLARLRLYSATEVHYYSECLDEQARACQKAALTEMTAATKILGRRRRRTRSQALHLEALQWQSMMTPSIVLRGTLVRQRAIVVPQLLCFQKKTAACTLQMRSFL